MAPLRKMMLALFFAAACGGSSEDELGTDDSDVAAGGAQVVVYSEDAWSELAEAFRADKAASATFFMHIPALAADKTSPRGPVEPANMRARGGQFRAMAEFH